jgi:hydrogenase maturation protease
VVETMPASHPDLRSVGTQILVLGVGDVGMGDLGVGAGVVEALDGRVPEGVRVLAPGSVGPSTATELDGVTHLLIVDCVDVGRAPGTVVVFDAVSLTPCVMTATVRDLELAHLLTLAGQHADAPEETVLLGVQPARTEPGVGLSAEVSAAVPELVELVLGVLRSWLDPTAPHPARSRPPEC